MGGAVKSHHSEKPFCQSTDIPTLPKLWPLIEAYGFPLPSWWPACSYEIHFENFSSKREICEV